MNLKKLRLYLLLYAAFDLFIGGYNGGLVPLSLLVPQAKAQQIVPLTSTRASNLSFVGGKFIANEYGNYGNNAAIYTGNASTGSSTITVRGGYINLSDGRGVVPYAVGVPFVINDTTPELVTPTAVSGCYKAQGMNQDATLTTCTITASFSFTHGVGATITSGTGGIAEAAYDAFQWANSNPPQGGGVVLIEPGYFLNTGCTNCFASKAAAIAALIPYGNVSIEDDSVGPPVFYTERATGTSTTASPSAPTLTAVACPAGITGLSAGAYFAKVATVDVTGMPSQASSESGSATTTTALPCLTLTVPGATAGQVGILAYLTQAGGGSGNETLYNLTSTNCTLTKVESIIPACIITNINYNQVGATITLTANNASSTAKVLGTETVNRTAFAYQLVTGVPQIFTNLVLSQPATSTTAGTFQLIGMPLPAAVFNFVTRKVRACWSGHDTFGGVAGQTLAFTLAYGPYNNSDTTLITTGTSAAGTATAGTQTFQGCAELNVTASGASGTIQAHGNWHLNLANSNVDSPLVDQQAAATSLPLSTQQWLRLQLVVGAQNLAAGFVLDSFSIEPAI